MKIFRVVSVIVLTWCSSAPVFALDGGVESLRETGKAFAAVARSVSPSVVFIQVETSASGPSAGGSAPSFGGELPFGDDFFKRFFGDQFRGAPRGRGQGQPRHAVGQGSGFVFKSKHGMLSDKTYILTNNHVVEHADSIRVKFQDGREFDGEVTGTDPQSDVAVIEIKAGDMTPLPLGDSSKLDVGEWVVAIGNPFGLSHTLTVGVVSAKGRTGLGINDYEDFIQTDAAINPGNSGGPLVNLDGEAIGINTAIFSRSGGYMGVGFAIPINLVSAIADQLIDNGEVTRGYLGVLIQSLTPELAESFGLEQSRGILISQVSEDSPAARAGLREGDVVVGFRGKPASDVGDFRNRVSLTEPGTKVPLTVLRHGKRKTITVEIGKLTEDKLAALGGPAESADALGLTVQTLTPQLADQFDTDAGKGVVVTAVEAGSIAAMAGIKPGIVIVEANRKPVNNAAAFAREVKQSSDEKRILLLLRDGNAQRFVVLNW